MKIPTGCHDCKYNHFYELYNEEICLAKAHMLIKNFISLKKFHHYCPHKEEYEMKLKLMQL